MTSCRLKLLTAAAVFAGAVGLWAPPAAAQNDPVSVSFKLEGCKQENLPAGYDIELANFLCDEPNNPLPGDTAAGYTTGNLGKLWNELDLVPHRVTAIAGGNAPATQTYRVAIGADSKDAGHPGYDFISEPVLNATLSDASCSVVVGALQTLIPGAGGTDESLGRFLDITQDAGTTCVFDYVERLALGSHLFPGSSLHSNLFNQVFTSAGIGHKDVSIPVKEILPQELTKDMLAVRDSDFVWNVTKEATPVNIDFADTCELDAPEPVSLQVTVTWQKAPGPLGEIMVWTTVTAINPAARQVRVLISDDIRGSIDGGPDVSLDVADNGAGVIVDANSSTVVFEHHALVDPLADNLNDVATATYVDVIFPDIEIPGQTTATASAEIQTGQTFNDMADISDTESISGSDLTFSVDSFVGPGAMVGYTLGDETTGPVNWEALDQNGGGSVVFNKSVFANVPTNASETLSDTATVTPGDGGATDQDTANVAVTASALFDLTITKNIPDVLQGTEEVTFDFVVTGPGGPHNASVTLVAGETSKSTTIFDLEAGNYTVTEQANPPWTPASNDVPVSFVVTGVPADCFDEVDFDNDFDRASARVQKICTGDTGTFQMTLSGPGGPETVNADCGAGFVNFSTVLEEGDYTVTEQLPDGWRQDSSDCTFSVDYPADAGAVFDCTFENTKLGKIIIDKVTDPANDPQSFNFTLTGGPSALNQAFSLTDTATPHDSGFVEPGSGYNAAETVPDGWDLTSATCDDNSPVNNIDVSPGETVTCTFTNTKRGRILIDKNTVPPGDPQSFNFTLTGGPSALNQAFSLNHDSALHNSGFVKPGSGYVAVETVPAPTPQVIWTLTSATCDDNSPVNNIDVSPGETVTCTFVNTKTVAQGGTITIIKNAIGGDGTFEYDSNITPPGGSIDGVAEFTLTTVGGTAQITFNNVNTSLLATTPYTVVELFPLPGLFGLDSLVCVEDGLQNSNPLTAQAIVQASLNLDDGENITCTYTNSLPTEACSPGFVKTHPELWDGSDDAFDNGLNIVPAVDCGGSNADDETDHVKTCRNFGEFVGGACFGPPETDITILQAAETNGGGFDKFLRFAGANLFMAEALSNGSFTLDELLPQLRLACEDFFDGGPKTIFNGVVDLLVEASSHDDGKVCPFEPQTIQ